MSFEINYRDLIGNQNEGPRVDQPLAGEEESPGEGESFIGSIRELGLLFQDVINNGKDLIRLAAQYKSGQIGSSQANTAGPGPGIEAMIQKLHSEYGNITIAQLLQTLMQQYGGLKLSQLLEIIKRQ